MTTRVFLLSPADCAGQRAQLILRAGARFDLAFRLRSRAGAPIGEVFSFLSGLYFRGKLTYALSFARPPTGRDGVLVITSCQGLRSPEARVNPRLLRRYAGVDIDATELRYRRPLVRDARALAAALGEAAPWQVVLLGSVASAKYAEPLAEVFGERLVFPADFAGRGDMSRGGLLLRCVADGRELHYVPLIHAPRHGPRPGRLPPVSREREPRVVRTGPSGG